MNYFYFVFKSACKDLIRNKVRTFLTSLGIVIGVSSVILLITFSLGLKDFIRNQFYNLGTNLVYVLRGKSFTQGGSVMNSGIEGVKFDEKDYFKLKKIAEADIVLPVYSKILDAQAEGKTDTGTLYATIPEMFSARNLELESGVLFSKTDIDKKSKVTVLGSKIAANIFGDPISAVNRSIRIDSQVFKIIGVLKAKGGGGFATPNFDTFMYVPYKSAYFVNTDKIFTAFVIKARNENDISLIKRILEEILLKRYKKDDFTVADQTEFINTIFAIFSVLNTVLIGTGAISLLVGGIGIMNIMYVSVSERTNEIGIRRALGATKKDILNQFLIEAIVLSLIGGVVGLIVADMVIFGVSPLFPVQINLLSMIVALSVSSSIGIFFGVFPARKAAGLSPIDAIRYE